MPPLVPLSSSVLTPDLLRSRKEALQIHMLPGIVVAGPRATGTVGTPVSGHVAWGSPAGTLAITHSLQWASLDPPHPPPLPLLFLRSWWYPGDSQGSGAGNSGVGPRSSRSPRLLPPLRGQATVKQRSLESSTSRRTGLSPLGVWFKEPF